MAHTFVNVVETNLVVRWEDSRILHKEPDWRRRNIVQSLFMAIENEPLSRPSLDISYFYLNIVRQEIEH